MITASSTVTFPRWCRRPHTYMVWTRNCHTLWWFTQHFRGKHYFLNTFKVIIFGSWCASTNLASIQYRSLAYQQVAYTNWKRVMFVLNNSKPYQDPTSIPGDLVHIPDKFTYLNGSAIISGLVKIGGFFVNRQSWSTTLSSCLSVTSLPIETISCGTMTNFY